MPRASCFRWLSTYKNSLAGGQDLEGRTSRVPPHRKSFFRKSVFRSQHGMSTQERDWSQNDSSLSCRLRRGHTHCSRMQGQFYSQKLCWKHLHFLLELEAILFGTFSSDVLLSLHYEQASCYQTLSRRDLLQLLWCTTTSDWRAGHTKGDQSHPLFCLHLQKCNLPADKLRDVHPPCLLGHLGFFLDSPSLKASVLRVHYLPSNGSVIGRPHSQDTRELAQFTCIAASVRWERSVCVYAEHGYDCVLKPWNVFYHLLMPAWFVPQGYVHPKLSLQCAWGWWDF